MINIPFLTPARLGWVGLILGIGLVVIAIIVDMTHTQLTVGLKNVSEIYKDDPAQWIILTSPFFLTLVFHFLGKGMHEREVKLQERAIFEHQQSEMLEEFIEQLESGNLSAKLSDSFSNVSLSEKLAHFRNNLVTNRDDEQRRIWEKEGLAQFGELIRSTQDIQKLSEEVIKFIVNYVNCNQGAVFIAKENDGNVSLERTACYAYERKKHGTYSVSPGSGLVGECYLEKETIILSQVPDNYIQITSGLGEATPSFVIILPLKHNDIINGVLELAAFKKLEAYQVAFLEKSCEAFCSVINAAVTSDNIKHLLEDSQQRTEELRTQEEEMRQNMEELQSIQEQMTRQLNEQSDLRKEAETRERVLSQAILLSEMDLSGTITHVNLKFCEVSGYSEGEIVGKSQTVLRHTDMAKELLQNMWSILRRGEVFSGVLKNRTKAGNHYWVETTIVPVLEEGRIIKYMSADHFIWDEEAAQKLFAGQSLKGVKDQNAQPDAELRKAMLQNR